MLRPRPAPGTSRPRPRTSIRLEPLETRLLLSGTDQSAVTDHTVPVLIGPPRSGDVLPPTLPADTPTILIPVTSSDAYPKDLKAATDLLRQIHSDVEAAESNPAWAVNEVAVTQGILGFSPTTVKQVSVEASKNPHHSVDTAEPLPTFESVLIHGQTVGSTGPDVYRISFPTPSASVEIEVSAKSEQDATGIQVEMVDEKGRQLCQLTVPGVVSTVRVTLKPPQGSASDSIFVGIGGVSSKGAFGPADYTLSVTHQGQGTSAPASGSSTSQATGPTAPSSPVRAAPSASPGTTSIIVTAGIQPATVRPVADSLPARIGSPTAGLLAFGDPAPAVVPIADAVDLALLEMIPDEALGSLPGDGIPFASEAEVAHATAGGELPLIALGVQACEEDDSAAPPPSAKQAAAVALSIVSDRAAVADRGEVETARPRCRRGLFQTGISLAAAVAFSLLLPEATAALHFARQTRRPLIVNGRRVRTEE